MSTHQIHLRIGDRELDVEVADHMVLLDLLRDVLGFTGTKDGCGVGVCGVCSVLVDGDVLSACLLPALYVDGSTVETIETLSRQGELSALQAAFLREGGLQCGICTSGQIVAATALLREDPNPSDSVIREWMTGNLCRCTGYYKIVKSIQAAAETRSTARR
jgi:aerobic-type carbon monoxide dehydrogenase small subunit (CoxS/CutS family)